jgi:hypothetical protein
MRSPQRHARGAGLIHAGLRSSRWTLGDLAHRGSLARRGPCSPGVGAHVGKQPFQALVGSIQVQLQQRAGCRAWRDLSGRLRVRAKLAAIEMLARAFPRRLCVDRSATTSTMHGQAPYPVDNNAGRRKKFHCRQRGEHLQNPGNSSELLPGGPIQSLPRCPLRSGFGGPLPKCGGRIGATSGFLPMFKQRNNAVLDLSFRRIRHSDGAYWRGGLLVFRAPRPAQAPDLNRFEQAVGIDIQPAAPLADHDRRAQILGKHAPMVPACGNAARSGGCSAAEAKPLGSFLPTLSRFNHGRYQTRTPRHYVRTQPPPDEPGIRPLYRAADKHSFDLFHRLDAVRRRPKRAQVELWKRSAQFAGEKRLTASRNKQRGAFKI